MKRVRRHRLLRLRRMFGHSEPHLHPTKGWRGDGVKPRGTNKRRVLPT